MLTLNHYQHHLFSARSLYLSLLCLDILLFVQSCYTMPQVSCLYLFVFHHLMDNRHPASKSIALLATFSRLPSILSPIYSSHQASCFLSKSGMVLSQTSQIESHFKSSIFLSLSEIPLWIHFRMMIMFFPAVHMGGYNQPANHVINFTSVWSMSS